MQLFGFDLPPLRTNPDGTLISSALDHFTRTLDRWADETARRAPWGSLDHVAITASQNTIGALVDVTNAVVSWSAIKGRRYRISGMFLVLQNVAAGIAEIRITDSANVQYATWAETLQAGEYATFFPSVVLDALSGPVTFKCRAITSGGNMNIQASATQQAYILVEDLGPVK